jgi:hypothetical protein
LHAEQPLAEQFFDAFLRGTTNEPILVGRALLAALADSLAPQSGDDLEALWQAALEMPDSLARAPHRTWPLEAAPVRQQLDHAAVDEYFAQTADASDLTGPDE